jgi:hypothetical protein
MKKAALWIGGGAVFITGFWLQDSFWRWVGFGIPWWGYVLFWAPLAAIALWVARDNSN